MYYVDVDLKFDGRKCECLKQFIVVLDNTVCAEKPVEIEFWLAAERKP